MPAFHRPDDGRERTHGERLGREVQVAVAALEARLVLERNSRIAQSAGGRSAKRRSAGATHLAGVRTAAHGFAVRRKDQRSDALEVLRIENFGETLMQTLDGERRRDLADEAAGVGEAGLQADALAATDIVDVGLLFEQALDEAGAGFESGGVSNSGEMSTMWSTPNSLAKKSAISTVAGLSHSAMR